MAQPVNSTATPGGVRVIQILSASNIVAVQAFAIPTLSQRHLGR
jgi:hypothetical protein